MKKRVQHSWMLILFSGLFLSCEDFLEIEAPDHKLPTEVVFSADETAISAMQGIYNQLSLVSFSNGGHNSVTAITGLSADNLTTLRDNNLPYMEFEQHEIQADNVRNYNMWKSAYNMVYLTNSLLEGLEESSQLSEPVRLDLEGEARFVRAFTYFYLVNLYGEVPLILTTDYRTNSQVSRDPQDAIYEQIETDLWTAIDLLEDGYPTGERTKVNRFAAIALMARVQLYQGNWKEAEDLSTRVLDQTGTYVLSEDLNDVFLANSKEAIWQLSPEGRGSMSVNTNEGTFFIIHPFLTFLSHVKLTDHFVESMDENDKRFQSWINYNSRVESHYPFKYKIRYTTGEPTEYSMVLRLAEQYLIRAESRARQENLNGALADLDKIRARAGLGPVEEIIPTVSKETVLDQVFKERRKEFFTEWGHRWFDLKRTNRAEEILGEGNSLWENTDVLYPIPADERRKNLNLTQNNGY